MNDLAAHITQIDPAVQPVADATKPEQPEALPPNTPEEEFPAWLWNLDSCKEQSSVFLCMDQRLAKVLESHGVRNVVALVGNQPLSSEALGLFDQCAIRNVTVVLEDSSEDGAANRVVDLSTTLFARGVNVFILSVPSVDLDSYVADHGIDGFERLEKKPLIDWLLDGIAHDSTPLDLERGLEPILRLIATQSEFTREVYVDLIKKRFTALGKPTLRKIVDEIARDLATDSPTAQNADASEIEHSAQFGGLIDLVTLEGKPAFLVKDESGRLSVMEETVIGGVDHTPPPTEQIPWLLPNGARALEMARIEEHLSPAQADAALFDDLLAYHKGISELPSEGYYFLLAAWVLHTYLMERFQYSPIIYLVGVPERGKSRTGKGLTYLAYRGVHVESLRDAYLVRITDRFQSSIFFDCRGLWKKAEKAGSDDILLLRFERGATVPRVLYPQRGPFKDIVYYSIFGPTVIATNDASHEILETRCIRISMPETARKFLREVTAERALELKERLLLFRARHLDHELPEVGKLRGRLGDIIKPLHQIMRLVRPEVEREFLELIASIQAERQSEKAESIEAVVLKAVATLEPRKKHDFLMTDAIRTQINSSRTEKDHLSSIRINKILQSLGFRKIKLANGNMGIAWDAGLLERSMQAYGVWEPKKKQVRTGANIISGELKSSAAEQ